MARLSKNIFDSPSSNRPTPKGSAGYDNARENIDPHIKTKAFSTKEITLSDGSAAGFVKNDANGVLSGGNVVAGGGDVSAAANLTDETLVQGDGGAKGVKTSTATVTEIGLNSSARHTAGTDPNDHASGSDDQISSDFTHNSLTGLNAGTSYEHLSAAQVTEIGDNTTHRGVTTGNPHVVLLNEVSNPGGDKVFTMANRVLEFNYTAPNPAADHGAFQIEASGGFTGDLIHIHQHTGNPGTTNLVYLEADDTDVTPLVINNNGGEIFKFDNSGNLTLSGTVDGIDVAARDHAESHNAASHSDITVTGANIDASHAHTSADGSSHADVASNTSHRGLSNNPHSVDAADVSLGNVSNVATSDTAYNATSWNNNTDAATKNAIRDKIESLGGGHDAVTLNASATTGGLGLNTQEITNRAATNAQTGYATAAQITAIEANSAASHSNATDHASGSDDQSSSDFDHNSLTGLNDGTVYEHISAAQVSALHSNATDHASGSDDQTAGDFSHNSLANLNAGTSYEHITQTQKDALHSNSTDHTQDTDTALGSGCVAADHGTAATDMVVNISYGTGAAPTASTTTIGSLYITHEA